MAEDQSPSAPEQPQERPGYRGRCLYKTGKCTNERALKTSGAAHNLCEEHRNRQNQHQRKLDAKNRVARKDKRGGKQSGDAPRASAARFAPYPAAAVGVKKRSASLDAGEMVALAPATPSSAASSTQQQPLPPSAAGLHGLALAPPHHVALAHAPGDASAAAGAAAAAAVTAAASSAGMVYLPNGPQPPQLAYPFVMQDFDGIVVPLPSYLEGQDRIEFRARIYQKVLDFISEECILRFSGGGGGARVPPDSSNNTSNSNHGAAAYSSRANAADRAAAANDTAAKLGDSSATAGGATRSVSSSSISSSGSSSTATEASAASPAFVGAAQQFAEDPTGTASAPSSRRPSPSAADSNDQELGTAATAADGSSTGPGTPNSGAPTPTAAPKRLKRSARS